MSDASRVPAVISISSHVARGAVGNRAVVFALEALGCAAWSVPTVVLPWHPGHSRATRIVPPAADFDALLADLADAPWIGEVRAVASGYLGDARQAAAVAKLVTALKRRRPDLLYLCDPVIGDARGIYVPEATAIAQRDVLIPLADIATPNVHELAWMAGGPLDTAQEALAAARAFGPSTVLITSAPGAAPGRIANLLVSSEGVWSLAHEALANAPNGTGDLTAGLMLAHMLHGRSAFEAASRALASVSAVVSLTVKSGADELLLAGNADLLRQPAASVTARPIGLENDA